MHGAENLWVDHLSGDTFRVRNIPAWAFGLSLDDEIAARVGDDERLTLSRVVARSGHSTYRIVPRDQDAFEQRWAALHHAGCRYESHATERLYAIDVPPDADIQEVYRLLEEGEADGIWDFEEGHCGHLVE